MESINDAEKISWFLISFRVTSWQR